MTPRQQRRLFRPRFTLAALLILITIVSLPLAYIGQRRAWNLKRKAALEALTAKGVGLSPEIPSEFGILPPPAAASVTPPVPAPQGFRKWWRGLLLEDAVQPIKLVAYSMTPRRKKEFAPLTDVDCHLLNLFPEIEFVELSDADSVTDQGLASLASMPNLRQIRISCLPLVEGGFLHGWRKDSPLQAIYFWQMEKLKGESLANVSSAESLEAFWIAHCPLLTDESLRGVELSPRVDRLMVRQCPLGDETIKRWLAGRQLKNLSLNARMTRGSAASIGSQTQLEQLYIYNSPLVDEDFEFLKHCKNLNNLTLESMPVRGDLLKWLPHPETIQTLGLSSTLLEDAHIAKLNRFTSLSSLYLNFTPISGEGFADAREFPCNCRVNLMGVQLNDTGKSALAAISFRTGINSEFSTVSLPSNWSVDDFKRFPGGKAPWKFEVDVPTASALRQATGERVQHYQSAWRSRWASEPLDNCPDDLMAPVIRLRKLAEERSDDEERRLVEEYLGIKPMSTASSTK